jgi:hypothetical protein
MPDKDFCPEHSGHEARLQLLEQNRIDVWRSLDKAHERVDGMKNWVIAGMSSLVMQLILWVVAILVAYLKLKGSA